MIFKFKAKSIDHNEFVYGSLIIRSGVLSDVYSILEQSMDVLDDEIISDIETKIDRDTICQYIGIKDNSGKMIFNNDIILFDKKIKYLIWYSEDENCYMLVNMKDYVEVKSLKWLQNAKGWAKIIGNKLD